MATTLSLVVIFLPIAFMNGYAKRFINPFGWTMAFAIMVSMLVSFTLTPMLSSRFLKLSDADADRKTKERGFFHWLDELVHAAGELGARPSRRHHRHLGRHGAADVPAEPHGRPRVRAQRGHGRVDDPPGRARRHVARGDERDRLQAAGGAGAASKAWRRSSRRLACRRNLSSPTHIHFLCQALPLDERKNTQAQIITEMRRRLAAHPSYRPSITSRNALGSGEGTGGFAIAANILGPDLEQIADYSKRALARGAELPSLTEPKITLNVSNPGDPRRRRPQARRRPRRADGDHRQHAAARGVGRRRDLVLQGRAGAVPGQDPRAREPAPRHRGDRPADRAVGERARCASTTSPSIERGLGPTTLQRSDRQFAVSFIADVAPGHALDEASNDVRKMLAGLNMPPTMSFRLQGQSKILDETTANLVMAIGLAMIFVYMVLASQFESFLQPVVIMLVMPIAVPFALFTLWVTGRTLNLWSALGMLLLLGIVKKNSILQVDYANVLRARGLPLREAIVESCRTRLRPILMTTTAIIAGLIPTSLGIGIGGTGRAAIAVTIIGGQSLCLFLTLLLVPVAYVKFDALEQALVGEPAKAWLVGRPAATIGRLRPARESLKGKKDCVRAAGPRIQIRT